MLNHEKSKHDASNEPSLPGVPTHEQAVRIFANRSELSSAVGGKTPFGSWSGITHHGFTDSKYKSGENQDSFGVATAPNGRVAVLVSDGMGGHRSGEVASSVMLKFAIDEFLTGKRVLSALKKAPSHLLKHLNTQGSTVPDKIGATMVSAEIYKSKNGQSRVQLAHCGDAKAIVIRPAERRVVHQTKDQSQVQAFIDAGQIDESAARKVPWRNVILSCLGLKHGQPREFDMQQHRLSLNNGDLLISSSDLLKSSLTTAEILDLACSHQEPEKLVLELQDAIRSWISQCVKDGHSERAVDDNFTLVVLKIDQ